MHNFFSLCRKNVRIDGGLIVWLLQRAGLTSAKIKANLIRLSCCSLTHRPQMHVHVFTLARAHAHTERRKEKNCRKYTFTHRIRRLHARSARNEDDNSNSRSSGVLSHWPLTAPHGPSFVLLHEPRWKVWQVHLKEIFSASLLWFFFSFLFLFKIPQDFEAL